MHRPFYRLVATSFAVASLVACSGAKEQLVDEAPAEDAGATTVASSGGASGGSGGASGSGSGGSSGSAGTSGSGSSSGSGSGSGSGSSSGNGSSGGSGGGGVTAAPTTCPADGVTEDGSNDKRSSAMEFDTTACGTTSTNGIDWWTFRLATDAKTIGIAWSGAIVLQVESQGDMALIGTGTSNQQLPFHPGGQYTVAVTSTHGDAEPYVFVVQGQ